MRLVVPSDVERFGHVSSSCMLVRCDAGAVEGIDAFWNDDDQ